MRGWFCGVCSVKDAVHDRTWVLLQQWGRVPALNTNATFIDDLAAMVLEKLPSAAPRPGYTPSLNETMNLGPPTGAATPSAQWRDSLMRQLKKRLHVAAFGSCGM